MSKYSQRDYMRKLVRKYGVYNYGPIGRAYVRAEMAGLVSRISRTLTPEAYAFALYHDMLTKGWWDAPTREDLNSYLMPTPGSVYERKEH